MPSRQVYCRGCGRTTEVPVPESRGHPYGWYMLSVNVPPEIGSHGKPYIYIGLFCCTDCLIGHQDELREADMLTQGVYERE